VAALLHEPALDFKLWGTLWERSRFAGELAKRFGPIRPVLREDYNRAINGAGIALAFLSRLNRDTYTRRCFEIPITGALLLSQYSADLATLFEEGVEAEFFRSQDELLDKVRFYSRNDEARRKIGLAGRARVLRDGHEALDRAKQVLAAIEQDR
jgi:spore maturation protein CgeB